MSQYRDGAISIANNSNTVDGVDTAFLNNILPGQYFRVNDGSAPVIYQVSGVVSNVQFTISAPYGGADVVEVPYTVSRDFSVNYDFPVPNANDLQTASIVSQAIHKIDSLIYGLDPSRGTYVDLDQDGNEATPTNQQLKTYMLPANFLSENGKGIAIKCWGVIIGDAPSKSVNLIVGNVQGIGISPDGDGCFKLEATLFRKGPSSQSWQGYSIFGFPTGVVAASCTALQIDDTSEIPIRVQSSVTELFENSVVINGLQIDFIN